MIFFIGTKETNEENPSTKTKIYLYFKVYGEIGLSVEIGPNSKVVNFLVVDNIVHEICLLYTSPSPRD